VFVKRDQFRTKKSVDKRKLAAVRLGRSVTSYIDLTSFQEKSIYAKLP